MKVVVTRYNTEWPRMFEEEASKIQKIFGEELIVIHHIGSTSVPGMMAKPIIDMMPLVREIGAVDKFNDKMREAGYEPMGEYGIPERRFFRKGGDNRTHHIHVFQLNGRDVERHLAFCDYLRHHRDDGERYGQLKQYLAERYPDDISEYMNGKNEWVKSMEKKAVQWYRERK